jgi:gliding motility-associated-like protein
VILLLSPQPLIPHCFRQLPLTRLLEVSALTVLNRSGRAGLAVRKLPAGHGSCQRRLSLKPYISEAMRPVFLLVMILFSVRAVRAQGQEMNWAFGRGIGISFSSGTPQLLNTAIVSSEGVASISDAAGNLLFYTNGVQIWNRNHQPMPNGGNLLGSTSSSQGCVIVPIPESETRYYLFTVGAQEQAVGDLRYSVIDMNLNGGLGDVENGSKNILLGNGYGERLVSATGTNCSYWVITHELGNSTFAARRVTRNGIEPPVLSAAGTSQLGPVGMIKMASDDQRLVLSSASGFNELFDFNRATGVVSNPIHLPATTQSIPYGSCFSPDNSKLYVSEGSYNNEVRFFQYDLSTYTEAAILASRTFMGISATTQSAISISDLQLGPDGRIYFTRLGMACVGVIPWPNLKYPFSGFTLEGVCTGAFQTLCLPNSVRARSSLTRFTLGNDTTICAGGSITLTAPAINATYLWSTGATTQSINVSAAGTYWVQLTNDGCRASDTINVGIATRRVNLGADTVICEGSQVTLRAGNFSQYQWQDGSVGPTLTISSPGTYWVEARDECGQLSRDTIEVTSVRYTVSLGPDRQVCPGDTVTLAAVGAFQAYAWGPDYHLQPQLNLARVSPPVDTTYYVRATLASGCVATDTVRVRVLQPQQVQLPPDASICAGSSLLLDAGSGFQSYRWSDGSTRSTLLLRDTQDTWVEVRDGNGCRSRDTIRLQWEDCGQQVWLPNAFTPNGDGKNDRFRARYQGALTFFQLTVYNRWGGIVFSTSNPDEGWDGRIGGRSADSGAFVWICRYQLWRRAPELTRGTMLLIR